MDISERIKYQLGQLMVQNTALAAEIEDLRARLTKYEEPEKGKKKEK